MTQLANFVFSNIFLVVILALLYYVYRQYKDLKDKTNSINDIFIKTLDKYLEGKINEARAIANKILSDHPDDEEAVAEVNRLLYQIELFKNGTINDKVSASNSINKFKVSKKIKMEKHPYLKPLNDLGTFTEDDMNSLENGVAIARKEYNAQAFRYNEKANGFPMQYLTKYLKLNSQFLIFDAPKYDRYSENYEVFEEKEPEISSLASLNRVPEVEEVVKKEMEATIDEEETLNVEQEIEYSDVILKPTKKIVQEIVTSDFIDELPKEKEVSKDENDSKDTKDKKNSKKEKKN